MDQLKLIVGARTVEGLRWARQNLYAVVVLTPLVLGMTYFGVGRIVRESEWRATDAQLLVMSIVTAACLLALSMSRASAEIYHTRRPEALFDALPVSADAQLLAALLSRLCRTSAVGAAALVLRWLAGGEMSDASATASLVLFVFVVASGEVLAALEWVHWARVRVRAQGVAMLVLLAVCASVGGLLLAEVLRSGGLTFAGRAEHFNDGGLISRTGSLVGAGLSSRAGLHAFAMLMTAMLAGLSFVLHRRWRAADGEFAKRLGARERWGTLVERVARRVCGGRAGVAAQLARDLQLTLRGFSSAVYVAAGLAALVVVALVALLTGGALHAGEGAGWLAATWTPSVLASKFACVLAAASLASVVPVLVAHQQPHLWLERSAGVGGEDALRAKIYFARVVTLPAPLATWSAGVLCGAVTVSYALPLLAECLWLWWVVSTLAGALAFEMPAQPGLALILMTCVAVGAGGLAALLWPTGLAIYAMGARQLNVRGVACARTHLKGEDA